MIETFNIFIFYLYYLDTNIIEKVDLYFVVSISTYHNQFSTTDLNVITW